MRHRFSLKFIQQQITMQVLIGTLLLTACAPALPPADPERAARLRNEALKHNLKHDYEGAAELYRQATLYAPQQSSTWLDLTEMQEAIDQPGAAVDSYQRALKYLPATDSNREFIAYRLALLLAWRLESPGKAEDWLGKVHAPDLKNDLTGIIALSRNDARQSLVHFQEALRHAQDKDRYARIYFHIALAYDQIGEEDQSRDALLVAVEKARSRALKEDIRRFFESLLTRKS